MVVADVDSEAGPNVAAEVGGEFVLTDVSDLDANVAAIAFAVERFGGLDLVHLNAGVASGCGVGEDFDLALYRRAMGANLDGVVFGTHAALPALRARGGGAIVATASLAGLTSVPYDPLLRRQQARRRRAGPLAGIGLADEGIRFNAVCPGFSDSAIIDPIREALTSSGVPIIPAETVADAVLRLFTEDVTGECWYVQAGREPEAFRFRGVPGVR